MLFWQRRRTSTARYGTPYGRPIGCDPEEGVCVGATLEKNGEAGENIEF